MSFAGTETIGFPSSPAVFSKPLETPIVNRHYKTAMSASATDDLDAFLPSLPGSPLFFTLSEEMPSRPPSRAGTDVDNIVQSRYNSPPPCGPFPQTTSFSRQLSMIYQEPGIHLPRHGDFNPRMSAIETTPLPDETTVNPVLLNCVITELNALSAKKLERLESAMFNLKDHKIDEEPRKFAQRVLGLLLKDVSNTGPFYLLSANNVLYVLMTIYPATRYAEVRANIMFNVGCAGIHYLSGCLKYDVLNRKDFQKFRPITYALFGMILGHLARAYYQFTMLSGVDWQEPWPTDRSLFNEANQIRFAAAGWTLLQEIIVLEIWYASVPVIR